MTENRSANLGPESGHCPHCHELLVGEGGAFEFGLGPGGSLYCPKCKGTLTSEHADAFGVFIKSMREGAAAGGGAKSDPETGHCPHCAENLIRADAQLNVVMAPSKTKPEEQGAFCPKCGAEFTLEQFKKLAKSALLASRDAEAKRIGGADAKKGPCFVATAAFESAMHPEVEYLRRFRDERLARTPAGRMFIRGYNLGGPPLAALVRRSDSFRAMSRAAIRGICSLLRRLG